MDNQELLDTLSGEVNPLEEIVGDIDSSAEIEGDISSTEEIDGDISLLSEIDGDVESTGDIDGDVEIPRSYVEKDYELLDNKPAINGHTLIGDQTAEELGIASNLTSDLDITESVGGVHSGSSYSEGTSLEQIMRDMFNPTKCPSLSPPFTTLSANKPTLAEKGSTVNVIFTLTLNRGLINPSYGTSGYRSGPADGYSLNGGTMQPTNDFFEAVTELNDTFTGVTSYTQGEQPKDSTGEDYAEPLPAGTVTSNTIIFEFVDAIWANTTNIATVTKQALVSKSVKQKEIVFPAQTATNPEIFDIPGSWTVTDVEVLNPLSNRWDSVIGEFDISNTTHNDAGGNEVAYKRYTDNRGYNAGSRTLRIKWI